MKRTDTLLLAVLLSLLAIPVHAAEPEQRTAAPGDQIQIGERVDFTFKAGDRIRLTIPGTDIEYTVPPATKPVEPTTKPTPAPNDPAPVDVVRIGQTPDSLARTIVSAKPNTTYHVTGDVGQVISSALYLRADNVKIIALKPTKLRVEAGPRQFNGIYVTGKNVELAGFQCSTNYTRNDREGNAARFVVFKAGGSGIVRDCTSDNLDELVHLDPDRGSVSVFNCETSNKHRGAGVWVTGMAPTLIQGCTLRSINEHPIRCETQSPADTGNLTVRQCKLLGDSGRTKELFTIRRGSGDFLIESTLIQIGNVGQTPKVGYGVRIGVEKGELFRPIGNVTFRNVRIVNGFMDVKRGNPPKSLTLDNVSFEGVMKQGPVSLNGMTATMRGVVWVKLGGASVKVEK